MSSIYIYVSILFVMYKAFYFIKKFSFFILSREGKDKCVEVYICKHVSVFSLYSMWSIYTCMYGVVCVCRVELSIYTYVSLSSSTCTHLCM